MSTQHDESTLLTETETPDEPLDRDDVFHILQCRRRRLVLKYLQEHDGPADMRDVTERIAAVENDTTVAQLRSQERQRVYIALYQSHLPKMDRAGIIEYDQNRGVVRRTERTVEFDPYLVNEPTLLPDESTDDAEPTEQEHAPERDSDRTTATRVDADADWRRRSLVAAGGGVALALSVYVDLLPPVATAFAVAAVACALVAAVAADRYGRGSTAEADA